MIWGRDTGCNWRTELEQGIVPKAKENVTIRLEHLNSKSYRSVQVYDPWKDTWHKVDVKDGKATIPTFIRSFVAVFQ
jgi:hypothetical protein